MTISFINKKLNQIKSDCEIIFIINKNFGHKWVRDKGVFADYGFDGAEGKLLFLPEKKRLYAGLESLAHDDQRIAAASAVNFLRDKNCRSVKIGYYGQAGAVAEGLILGDYAFDKYKSKKEKHPVKSAMIASESYSGEEIVAKEIKTQISESAIAAEAVNFTRDIVNQTPEDVNPPELAAIAKKLGEENGLAVKIHGEDYIKKEGMGAFLAVTKASPYPPQLIYLIYKPAKPKKKIALVGKGLTYDSGGLSLKPAEAMLSMKSDKSGASAILGIMSAASKLRLPVEVHGIIGAAENMPGQHAFKPDDILKAKNGKTIEVKNTDAEGRLVLADCLCYAQELSPDYIIDLATLTGACIVALGEYTSGIMGFDEGLKNSLKKAAEKSGELAAELPFNRFLPKLLKSGVADISNMSSSKYGGAITAALFLGEFVEKDYRDKWAHIDIAGPAFTDKPWGCNPAGASGAGVRMILEWLKTASA